jgi:2-phosphoglycerate kinase
MDEADAIATEKHKNKKSLMALSRVVVQTAEVAREIAVKNIDEEDAETARRDELYREANAARRPGVFDHFDGIR